MPCTCLLDPEYRFSEMCETHAAIWTEILKAEEDIAKVWRSNVELAITRARTACVMMTRSHHGLSGVVLADHVEAEIRWAVFGDVQPSFAPGHPLLHRHVQRTVENAVAWGQVPEVKSPPPPRPEQDPGVQLTEYFLQARQEKRMRRTEVATWVALASGLTALAVVMSMRLL